MKISVFDLTATRRLASIATLASFIFSNALAVSARLGDKTNVTGRASAAFTTDLTQLGREGRLRENLSFENETARLIKALVEGGIRQPVIVDEDKEALETIAEQAALKIANGSVPANLSGKSIIKVETAVLFSNSRVRAEIAQAVDAIVDEAIASKGQTILFVDELTTLVGTGAASTKLF